MFDKIKDDKTDRSKNIDAFMKMEKMSQDIYIAPAKTFFRQNTIQTTSKWSRYPLMSNYSGEYVLFIFVVTLLIASF